MRFDDLGLLLHKDGFNILFRNQIHVLVLLDVMVKLQFMSFYSIRKRYAAS